VVTKFILIELRLVKGQINGICIDLQNVVAYGSTYVLVALTIDRHDAIARPMNFSISGKHQSKAFVFILCSLQSMNINLLQQIGCRLLWEASVTLSLIVFFSVFPLLGLFILYSSLHSSCRLNGCSGGGRGRRGQVALSRGRHFKKDKKFRPVYGHLNGLQKLQLSISVNQRCSDV